MRLRNRATKPRRERAGAPPPGVPGGHLLRRQLVLGPNPLKSLARGTRAQNRGSIWEDGGHPMRGVQWPGGVASALPIRAKTLNNPIKSMPTNCLLISWPRHGIKDGRHRIGEKALWHPCVELWLTGCPTVRFWAPCVARRPNAPHSAVVRSAARRVLTLRAWRIGSNPPYPPSMPGGDKFLIV